MPSDLTLPEAASPMKRKYEKTNELWPRKGLGQGRVLSFSDLEIPVRPLLTHPEETACGRRIQNGLQRLKALLPLYPAGYLRVLSRMEESLIGGTPVFAWVALREELQKELPRLRKALERALALAARSPEASRRALVAGAKIMSRFPIDPETLTQWTREALSTERSGDRLARLAWSRRLGRILRTALSILEKHRDQLILPNFRLVLKEVFRYHPMGMKRSDLFQEGILGLQKAVFRYDPERGIRFSTYATYWIRQSIRKCLIDKSRMIRVPQAIQEELRKTAPAMAAGERERVRRIMGETVLFSHGDSDDSSDRFTVDVKDPSVPLLGAELHTGTIPGAVGAALRLLNSRERDVLQRRYGLAGERPQTLEEIGQHLNLSRERIRQIEQDALMRMRKSQDLQDVFEDLDMVECATAGPQRS